jgi:hypothetical protein
MPIEIEEFVRRWPYAYHLTSRDNLGSIYSSGRLETAYALLVEAGRHDMLRKKRDQSMKVLVNGL